MSLPFSVGVEVASAVALPQISANFVMLPPGTQIIVTFLAVQHSGEVGLDG